MRSHKIFYDEYAGDAITLGGTLWPVDPHAPSNFNNHPATNINTWRHAVEEAEKNPISLLHGWAKDVYEANASLVEPCKMKKKKRIRHLENLMEELLERYKALERRFEDYIALKRAVPGEVRFQEFKGTESMPASGEKMLGHHTKLGPCIVWYNNPGGWFASFGRQQESKYFFPVESKDVVWYKKIS